MKSKVFHISPTGQIETLYSEELPLFALGTTTITRASNIEFNNTEQLWEVKINDRILFSDASRARCIDWEHRYFNRVLMAK